MIPQPPAGWHWWGCGAHSLLIISKAVQTLHVSGIWWVIWSKEWEQDKWTKIVSQFSEELKAGFKQCGRVPFNVQFTSTTKLSPSLLSFCKCERNLSLEFFPCLLAGGPMCLNIAVNMMSWTYACCNPISAKGTTPQMHWKYLVNDPTEIWITLFYARKHSFIIRLVFSWLLWKHSCFFW